VRLLGLDPGLRNTGWGVIEAEGNRLVHVAHGTIKSDASRALSVRLNQLYEGVSQVVETWNPEAAAVEETFMNKNAASALKLGQARGVVLLAPARLGLEVAEYAATLVKQAVVGTGGAAKEQVQAMVKLLLGGAEIKGADAADALAVAICHAHHFRSPQALYAKAGGGQR
jgi:crossover junction endodeoxyribonuclease RuvC